MHAPQSRSQRPDPFVAWRIAMRELRGGLRGFYVLIACIALGVLAIAGVGSLSESLASGLAREGRTILGGDASFSLIHREATQAERAVLEARGRVSVAATMRAMARAANGRNALVEIKAVDSLYPLVGVAQLEPQGALADALAERDGAFGAAADPALLVRLEIAPGERITIGSAVFQIRAAIRSEPDKLADGIGFGPRLLIGESGLRATGLVQPGSLVRWHYRVRLPDGNAGDAAADALAEEVKSALPDAGWQIRTRNRASPRLERNVERFTQFLTLIGLTALLIGGVGVANAVKSHLDRRRDSIATMKSFGATGGRIFRIYLAQVLMLAGIGAAIGIAGGAALPFAVEAAFGRAIPLPMNPALHPERLALAFAFGMVTALAFAIWPLGRAHDTAVSSLFRDQVEAERRWPRQRYILAAAGATLMLAALAILLAYDRRIAAIFVAAAAAVFLGLRLVAWAIMAAARRMPHSRVMSWRLAVSNIHRPGALTPSIVLSLGLGLALLVTVIEIDGNLRRQFQESLPEKAPAFFFVDIQRGETETFSAFIRQRAPGGTLESVPMLRGRIVAANGISAENLKAPPDSAWVLQGDRGITYTGTIPAGSRLVEGDWWGTDYEGPPLVSFERRIANGLGLKIGDPVTVNVLGRNITATIANMREVDWQSLGINFVLVFSPNAFSGAPHTHIATLTYPDGSTLQQEMALLRDAADAFPSITTVRVKDALDAVSGIVGNLVLGIRGASIVTLLAAALVLAGALAASHHHRVYDAVILKTLGASRRRLIATYTLEYLLLGAITALFGVIAGSLSAWVVSTKVMNIGFVWLPWPALAASAIALAITISFGLIGTFSALSQKPAPVLRNL